MFSSEYEVPSFIKEKKNCGQSLLLSLPRLFFILFQCLCRNHCTPHKEISWKDEYLWERSPWQFQFHNKCRHSLSEINLEINRKEKFVLQDNIHFHELSDLLGILLFKKAKIK